MIARQKGWKDRVQYSLSRTGIFFLFVLLWSLPVTGQGVEDIDADMVAAHNAVRSRLGLPDLVWSEELADYAREWALYLAEEKSCRIEHRPRNGEYARKYGENLYWASPVRYSDGRREVQDVRAEAVVADWVGEAKYFDYEANSCRENRACGHYTQVVWRATERLGCARAVCPDKGQVWVCNYDPGGNRVGQRPY